MDLFPVSGGIELVLDELQVAPQDAAVRSPSS